MHNISAIHYFRKHRLDGRCIHPLSRALLYATALTGALAVAAPCAADTPAPGSGALAAKDSHPGEPPPMSGPASSEPLPGESPSPEATPAPTTAQQPQESLAPTALGERDQASSAELPYVPPARKQLRLELGGRLGYSISKGDFSKDLAMGDVFKGSIPLMFDLWGRLRGGLAVGLYLQVGIGIQGKELDDCDGCSLWNIRVGLQAAQHFNSEGAVDPWVGIGFGVDDTSVTADRMYGSETYRVESSYRAFPEAMVQAGVDFGTDRIAFGPFISATYASYSKVSIKTACANDIGCSGFYEGETDGSVASGNRAGHSWLLAGVRGTFLN